MLSELIIATLIAISGVNAMALPNPAPHPMITPAADFSKRQACGSIFNPCGGDPSAYGQCGGLLGGSPWPSSHTACPTGWQCACVTQGQYSMCISQGASVTCTIPSSNNNQGTQTEWGQCGGQNYAGPTKCATSLTCSGTDAYYSMCYPKTS